MVSGSALLILLMGMVSGCEDAPESNQPTTVGRVEPTPVSSAESEDHGTREGEPGEGSGAEGDVGEPATEEAEPPELTLPVDLLGHDGGATLFFTRPADDDRSEIMSRTLDRVGVPTGDDRVLRTTTGEVGVLRALRLGDRTGLVFCTTTPANREAYGLLWLGADGAVDGRLVRLGLDRAWEYYYEGCGFQAMTDGDEAILVARQAGTTRCQIHEGEPMDDCPAVAVERVEIDGTVTRLGTAHVEAAGGPPSSLVRTPAGAVLFLQDVHVYRSTFVSLHPLIAGQQPDHDHICNSLPCNSGRVRLPGLDGISAHAAWDGTGFVFVGSHEPDFTARVGVWRRDQIGPDGEVRFPLLRRTMVQCRAGKPVIVLRGAGGLQAELPIVDRGEASFRAADFMQGNFYARNYGPTAALAWTGTSLITAEGPGNSTGEVELYPFRCRGRRLHEIPRAAP
ncbi:MAG: hypothetical protein DRJ42_16795 [Deltaproteobacteria bacterium]|nr:MAG: hypothetical protein DRJ42_16795 [Deltaproteobacteria bacterium]